MGACSPSDAFSRSRRPFGALKWITRSPVSTLAVATGLSVPAVPTTEHLKPGRVKYEVAKVEKGRAPPVAVEVSLLPERATRGGLLYGWSTNTSDGLLRGLCTWLREYTPGFWQEFVGSPRTD